MCKTTQENKTVEAQILLDTGAGGLFMNSAYAKKHNFLLYSLKQPITPRNVDGTPNSQGKITHYTWIRHRIGSIWLLEWLLVTGIGTHNIIFGLPWFQKYQPIVNWTSGKITIDKEPCQLQIKYWKTDQIRRAEIKDAPTTTINAMESQEEYDKEVQELYDRIQQQMDQEINEAKKRWQERQMPKIVEEEDKDTLLNQTQLTLDDDETAIIAFITGQTDNKLWINTKANVSTALASEQNLKKEERTLDEMLPPELMDYRHVFDKTTAERFPESCPWDHAINLKDDFIPKDCKVYPLTVPEQAELDKFLK